MLFNWGPPRLVVCKTWFYLFVELTVLKVRLILSRSYSPKIETTTPWITVRTCQILNHILHTTICTLVFEVSEITLNC